MTGRWVWFDFDNTPHVLFLEPIIRELSELGAEVVITARPQAQTLDLATLRGFHVHPVGPGDLTGRAAKMMGAVARAGRLAAWVAGRGRPTLLVSSSRAASLAAWVLRVPAVGLLDYEHAEHRTLTLACQALWLPDILRNADWPKRTRRVARFYPGLKENLYLDAWSPNREAERAVLQVQRAEYLVVARPPATSAHYSTAESMESWVNAIRHLLQCPSVRILVTPRTVAQRIELSGVLGGMERVAVIRETILGPAVVAAADLILGGGGTMNREAAVLGVPVWSTFTGRTPRIDQELAKEGRLTWVRTLAEGASALAAGLPGRLPPRGPYPEGLATVMRDIRHRLARAP